MGRTSAWRSAFVAAALVGAAACSETITTPGRCPDYCPGDSLLVVDTVLTGVVVADTSIRGYNQVHQLGFLLAGDQDSLRALAYLKFLSVPQFWLVGTDTITVGTIDSIALQLGLQGRDTAAPGLRVLVYRAPVTLDTLTAVFDSLLAATAGPLLDSVPVEDSVAAGTLRRLVPIAAFTPQAGDSNRIALVLDARAASPTTVTLASSQAGGQARISFYVHGAAPRDTFRTTLSTFADFDTYARNPEPVVGQSAGIVVGDQPAARAFVHFDLPTFIAESVLVLRASLTMRLNRPAAGRPGEQFLLQAHPVLRYFGGKSIVLEDSSLSGTGLVTAGDTGSVVMEMARVLRFWRGTSRDSIPRVVSIRNGIESVSLGGLEAVGSAGGVNAPRLVITYIRRFSFTVP